MWPLSLEDARLGTQRRQSGGPSDWVLPQESGHEDALSVDYSGNVSQAGLAGLLNDLSEALGTEVFELKAEADVQPKESASGAVPGPSSEAPQRDQDYPQGQWGTQYWMEECLYLFTIYLAIYLNWMLLDFARRFLDDRDWPSRLH